jgi:hypothetical protein
MEYKHFYIAIRRYVKSRITRNEFLIDWEYAQRRQGIETEEMGERKYDRKAK